MKLYKDMSLYAGELERHTLMYPSLAEQGLNNNKLLQIRLMDQVAEQMQSFRPQTFSIDAYKSLAQKDLEVVGKRSHSGCSLHYLGPNSFSLEQLNSKDPILYWFVQEYVPELRLGGELRVFIWDKKVRHMVWTKYNEADQEMAVHQLELTISLQSIRTE